MLTTVVGSYPPYPRGPTSLIEKIQDIFGMYDKYKPAIELAVVDQIKAGIDIISDGQVRGNMIEIFAKKIPGMDFVNGSAIVYGKILPPKNPITVEDVKFAIKLKNKIKKNVKVKGIITGPCTLAYSSKIEGFYKSKENLMFDIAEALKVEAKFLEKLDIAMIQIDEPILSTGIVNIKTAKKVIETITDEVSIPISLHVCGSIVDIFEKLLEFNVDIIDCEFAGTKENLNILEDVDLKGKKIGFGCVNTKTNKVESVEEIKKRILKGIELIGKENMVIDPDCGLRNLKRKSAFNKLKNMVRAAHAISN